jgi:PKD repeat protein
MRAKPKAAFTFSPQSPLPGEIIYFAASADPDSPITRYEWDLGDGTFGSGQYINHSYTNSGIYPVKLTVYNEIDEWSEATSIVLVNQPPTAAFTINPTSAMTNQDVFFDGSASYDPDGTIISYDWDFGDGAGSGQSIYHAFYKPDHYQVWLTVTDDSGLTSQVSHEITILNHPPIAAFTISPNPAIVNQPITFDASSSSDPDGMIIGYEWDFGDGTIQIDQIVTYSFAAAGKYKVTLLVIDEAGLTNTISHEIQVNTAPIRGIPWC